MSQGNVQMLSGNEACALAAIAAGARFFAGELLPQVMVSQLIFGDASEDILIVRVFHRFRQSLVDEMLGYFTLLHGQNLRFYFRWQF